MCVVDEFVASCRVPVLLQYPTDRRKTSPEAAQRSSTPHVLIFHPHFRHHKHGGHHHGGHHLQPMAPYNTTQFLLDDRDERGHNSDEEPVIDDAMGTAVVDHRFRCYSVSSEPHNQSSEGSVSGSEDDNEMERDFEADFESVKLERFDSMSRDEVTRAMLQMEKSHGDLADHVVELRCENDRLKKLLNENGIAFDHHTLGRRRRSSNESSLGSNGSASNSNNEDNKPEE